MGFHHRPAVRDEAPHDLPLLVRHALELALVIRGRLHQRKEAKGGQGPAAVGVAAAHHVVLPQGAAVAASVHALLKELVSLVDGHDGRCRAPDAADGTQEFSDLLLRAEIRVRESAGARLVRLLDHAPAVQLVVSEVVKVLATLAAYGNRLDVLLLLVKVRRWQSAARGHDDDECLLRLCGSNCGVRAQRQNMDLTAQSVVVTVNLLLEVDALHVPYANLDTSKAIFI